VTTGDAASDTAGKSTTELAKEIQNPIADLISVPFQNNANFNDGPQKGTQDVLNVEPVIPFHISPERNLITRTIFPLTWQPPLASNIGGTFGLGDVNLSLFLSPKAPLQQLQRLFAAALRELQFRRGLARHLQPDFDGELAGPGGPAMGRPGRRRVWPGHQNIRQTADQSATQRLPQRRPPGRAGSSAASSPSSFDAHAKGRVE
jgi:hypothetical protein